MKGLGACSRGSFGLYILSRKKQPAQTRKRDSTRLQGASIFGKHVACWRVRCLHDDGEAAKDLEERRRLHHSALHLRAAGDGLGLLFGLTYFSLKETLRSSSAEV